MFLLWLLRVNLSFRDFLRLLKKRYLICLWKYPKIIYQLSCIVNVLFNKVFLSLEGVIFDFEDAICYGLEKIKGNSDLIELILILSKILVILSGL